MFHATKPGTSFINIEEYRDKVFGCWTGKNIGGTLGAPFEGKKETFDIKFYTQNLEGDPEPNDDLDLQLIFLRAIEDLGIYNVNQRVLGQYWLNYITGPWGEYGVAKMNMINGIIPPLSGAANNDKKKQSNGAWIRSEIWACMFPGEPDEVAPYAWYDACVDHTGDGIYAEIFTATLESAAFVESDLRKLINHGLAHIPEDCRVARSVKIAVDSYDSGEDWLTARNKVVEDSKDLGWFQAPANVAFVIIGLLYGEGDFGKSVCTAVNCGDDTDCTGATCGAILGIMKGRSGLPEEWIEPIGDAIKTIAINPQNAEVPKTLTELTTRVISCKKLIDAVNPAVLRLTDGETVIGDEIMSKLSQKEETEFRVLSRSSYEWEIPLPYGLLSLTFEKGPLMEPGETQKVTITLRDTQLANTVFSLNWKLPEGWKIKSGSRQDIMIPYYLWSHKITVELTAGEFDGCISIPLECSLSSRNYADYARITFQRKNTANSDNTLGSLYYWDNHDRRLAQQVK